MSATTTLESLREALAGEHSQLESWVQESFSAMDSLHSELAEWQRELTRQQTELDQRDATLKKSPGGREGDRLCRVEQDLAKANDEARQQHQELTAELRELRRLLERQGALLERLTDDSQAGDGVSAGGDDDAGQAAEHLRSASTRRAQRRPT